MRENSGEVSKSQELGGGHVEQFELYFSSWNMCFGRCFAREGHDQIYVFENHSSSSTENRFVDG